MLLLAGALPLPAERVGSFHFTHDIAPHLARAGCAAADCHGGATGRGGFKLSLFATNSRADYQAITQDLEGRRVDFADPERSLLLRKPTRQIRHKGGKRITVDSAAHRALVGWIKEGAPFAQGERRSLISLKAKLSEEQLRVIASFADSEGKHHDRDVTDLSRFASTNEQVVRVDQGGRLTKMGPGLAWVLASYGAHSARVSVVRSFEEGAFHPRTTGPQDLFNATWRTHLALLDLKAAKPAPDHQLLRRLYLDLCGRLPTLDEIRAYFENGSSPTETAVTLLESDEFVDQWSRHLWNWFEVPHPKDDLRHGADRNGRLRQAIRSYLASKGNLLKFACTIYTKPGRKEFVNRFGDPRDRAEFTGRALLGISIGCARCHNHPQDRWSQAQHLQFSAFFTDNRPVPGGEGRMMSGKFFLPGDGKAVQPALLPLGDPPASNSGQDAYGAQLADFLRTDASRAFSRNAANRIFGILLGRHLVESPDDHRLSNPSVFGGPLLELLADGFRGENYQLRPLIRYVVSSDLYRASSAPTDSAELGEAHVSYLARREARPLSGDAYLRAVAVLLGVPKPNVPAPDTPLAEQLHRLNGGLLQEWLRTPGNQIDAIFEFESDSAKQLEQLFLLVMTRPPTVEERKEFLPLLKNSKNPLSLGRDLALALLLSREFSSVR